MTPKKEKIQNVISDFYERDLSYLIARDLSVPSNTGKIISITGVRRSGKTSLLLQVIKKLYKEDVSKEQVLYLNFEDERLDLEKGELDLIIQAYLELFPHLELKNCYIFLDEIQEVEGWDKFVRRLYESYTKNIFITGSNAKFLSREISTALRGRAITYEVLPYSFKEYLTSKNIPAKTSGTKAMAMVASEFENYLFNGGFPETVNMDDAIRLKTLQEYYDVMIFRDILERYGITNIQALKFFIKKIFAALTSPVSVNAVYNQLKSLGLKIGKDSLYDYLEKITNVYLCFALHKYEPSVVKNTGAEKKIYVVDNGLVNALSFKFSKDYGKLLENVVFLELYRRGNKVFYHKQKKECDFLTVEKDRVSACYQVCYSLEDPEVRKRELAGLAEACNLFKLKKGTIVTYGEKENFTEDGLQITVVPAVEFLLNDK